ncbi:MAG: GTPase ObgE [Patescibacteria group bacterium]
MIDVVKLQFKAGKGGDGRVSFLRQKFRPKGGPDGGDGGDGGSVYLVGTHELNTLHNFVGKKSFKAQSGEMGGPQSMFGKRGEDLYIPVPVGMIVWKLEGELPGVIGMDLSSEEYTQERVEVSQRTLETLKLDQIPKTKIVEILEDGQTFLLAKGGKGGRGNEQFKSSSNTTPLEAEKGEPGEELEVLLELKLLADLGLVGFPNAGKSTFLSLVTKANPKIASYPFTTLEPNLGVMSVGDDKEVVIADIPGLIEGASAGKGLGIQFLRHVERCRGLMFVLFLEEDVIFDESLDVAAKVEKLKEQYEALVKELAGYGTQIAKLPQFISVSKIDLYDEELRAEIKRQLCVNSIDPVLWSAVTKEGLDELKRRVQNLLK